MHRNGRHGAHECHWVIDLNEQQVEDQSCSVFWLLGVLEMKDGIDKTGKKNNGKYCMHWNVSPDALPGSATYVRVLYRLLLDLIWYVYNKYQDEMRITLIEQKVRMLQ